MYRFLATDLDGTLLSDAKLVSPATLRTLLEAQERGLRIILASGRPLYSILPFAEQLQLSRFGGFIIAYNGSLVWDCANNTALRRQTIPMELIPALAAYASKDFNIMAYRGNAIVTENTNDHWGQHIAAINKMPFEAVPCFTEAITQLQHKCLFTGAPNKLWHLERKINEHFAGKLTAYRSEKFLLEVVPPGIDKAEALSILLQQQGSKPEELICCGDGFNDLPMMKLAGLSCATRNAQKPVKEAAHIVTDSNNRDGVAHVVEQYFLGR